MSDADNNSEKKAKLMEFWKPVGPSLWEKVEVEESEDPLENIKVKIRALPPELKDALDMKRERGPDLPTWNSDTYEGQNVYAVLAIRGLLIVSEKTTFGGTPLYEMSEEVAQAIDELRSEHGRQDEGDENSGGDVPQAPQEGEEGPEDSSGGSGSGEGSGEGGGQVMWLVEGVPLEDLEEAGLEADSFIPWVNEPKR